MILVFVLEFFKFVSFFNRVFRFVGVKISYLCYVLLYFLIIDFGSIIK